MAESDQEHGKALLEAQLLDLTNQIRRYRKALQELRRVAENVWVADYNQQLEFGRRVGFADLVRKTVEEALR